MTSIAASDSSNGVVVRAFAPGDAEHVAALIAATVRVSNASDYPPYIIDRVIAHYRPAQLHEYAREGRQCVVAEHPVRGIVGTAALKENELLTVYVLPAEQKQGTGAALLAHLERLAATAGYHDVHVESSVTAERFYTRLGYRRDGEPMMTDDAIHIPMRKAIG